MARDEKKSVNRKAEIISAAIEVFAETGYYRATTAQVAERANISQPYVFRFFATKEALLLSALELSWERIQQSFKQVVETAAGPEELESDLIEAYKEILSAHTNETYLQMQAQTMREEPIREAMRNGFREVHRIVLDAFRQKGLSNPGERTFLFLARGMLCNISWALDMPELIDRGV
ncbi:TetR family transcriptional regulator [Paenibacillus sp. FSL H7-0326]|uniref:TetR/AcrR family transcriptional regulator n=1 Tax=Paenibacillus sp. FSL H7-0326 TaxID=1921144 RepID=UPI00096C8784|nr:TetR/AcrR family transcriptional regulator [Paenibacillus sp. FSL H7-0326]OMC67466.1 TetR family transcriptional regulator [Paenibacillus sp. FSL H7-0326]